MDVSTDAKVNISQSTSSNFGVGWIMDKLWSCSKDTEAKANAQASNEIRPYPMKPIQPGLVGQPYQPSMQFRSNIDRDEALSANKTPKSFQRQLKFQSPSQAAPGSILSSGSHPSSKLGKTEPRKHLLAPFCSMCSFKFETDKIEA